MEMKKPQRIDARRSVISLQTSKEAFAFCCSHFLFLAKEILAVRPLTVALSGGSTPKGFYEALVSSQEAKALDWSRIIFFWSDERACPPAHPDSNFGLAMHYFEKEPFSKATFFRMPADAKDLQKAALEYEQLIKTHCFEGKMDIVYLGMGDDGHTASLFPGSSVLQENNHLVAAAYVEAKKSWRMTLTFRCINSARHSVVLVLGASKKAILKEALQEHSLLPIWHVGTTSSPALFICDHEAYEDSRN
jgi:6-phosphogluconolactonase